MRLIFLSVICYLVIIAAPVLAQDEQDSLLTDSVTANALRIFLDCSDCDFDYFRTEITFVNFVRHRQQADVHILMTTQRTGAGGEEFTIEFIGQLEFENMRDTLKHVVLESDTDDTIRSGLVRHIKIGLMRFAARTPMAKDISIGYSKPAQETTQIDKWKNWVFSLELNTWVNGQKSYRNLNFWWDIEAERVTARSKLDFSVWGSYNESKFDYEDYKALSLSRSKGTDGSYTFALDPDHWAAAFEVGVWSSTYSNLDYRIWNSVAVEYNIFPYSQSTRRQLRLIYELSLKYADYEEETIFGKRDEWLSQERLSVSLEYIQPWGSVNVSTYLSNYFHDFSMNHLQIHSSLSLSVIQGLSVNLNGSASRIRDQLSLRKGDASEDEVLLRRRELETSYDYYVSFGISYTFGSIYNNVVNPRFGG